MELGDRDRHDSTVLVLVSTHAQPWKRPEEKKKRTTGLDSDRRQLIPCSFLFYSSIHHNLAYRLLTPPLSCGILGPAVFFLVDRSPVPGLGLTEPCGEGREVGKKRGSTGLAWYEHGICMEAASTPTRWVATANPYSAQTAAITRHCRGGEGEPGSAVA